MFRLRSSPLICLLGSATLTQHLSAFLAQSEFSALIPVLRPTLPQPTQESLELIKFFGNPQAHEIKLDKLTCQRVVTIKLEPAPAPALSSPKQLEELVLCLKALPKEKPLYLDLGEKVNPASMMAQKAAGVAFYKQANRGRKHPVRTPHHF